VEGNCHFLEPRGFKTHPRRFPRQLSPQPRVAALHTERRLDRLPIGKLARIAKSVGARCQQSAQQVLLYCFRVANCGTFMPLSRVRGEFRIAVWTRFVAAFSAVSSVRFRILFTRVFSFAAVCG
jgi:hypothetical protein